MHMDKEPYLPDEDKNEDKTEIQELKGSTDLFAKLRKLGLRPTSARVCILQVLLASPQLPLSAESIFRELDSLGIRVSLGTIYRVLNDLEQCKLLQREWDVGHGTGKSRYLIAPAILPPPSYTFTCRECQRAIVVADRQLSEHLHNQAKVAQFDQQLATISIQVTCNSCAASAK
ncbi:Fur family transcriptional regulator [Undibacterium hunanense]|nr:transcriptional repressor [Undibacterium hunanense]